MDFVISGGLDRFIQLDFAPVDIEAFGFERLLDLDICHLAKELSFLADLHRNNQRNPRQLPGGGLRLTHKLLLLIADKFFLVLIGFQVSLIRDQHKSARQ